MEGIAALLAPYAGEILKWLGIGLGGLLLYFTGRSNMKANLQAQQAKKDAEAERNRNEIDRDIDRMSHADLDAELLKYKRK